MSSTVDYVVIYGERMVKTMRGGAVGQKSSRETSGLMACSESIR